MWHQFPAGTIKRRTPAGLSGCCDFKEDPEGSWSVATRCNLHACRDFGTSMGPAGVAHRLNVTFLPGKQAAAAMSCSMWRFTTRSLSVLREDWL